MKTQNTKYIGSGSNSFQKWLSWVTRHRLFWYCLLVSFVVLAVCSKSSFLYPFNDWVNANCYFTVGKGMMQGKVVYRDLLEQKGVLLYFLHGMAYLISHTTFIGVYFFEVIAGAFFLYFAAKTICLFLHERGAYILIPVLAALTYASSCFSHGDSAEEFCLPLLIAGLYCFLRFSRGEDLPPKALVFNGVLCGCVLWIKYTMIGFYLAWMPAVFFGMLIRKKTKQAFFCCLCFLMGIILSTIPWLIYFALNGALHDWFYTYFTMNLTLYGNIPSSLPAIVETVKTNLYAAALKSKLMLCAMIVAAGGFLCTNRFLRGVWPKISLALLFCMLALSVYGGGRKYPYYFLIFYVFAVLALIVAAKFSLFLISRIKAQARGNHPIPARLFRRLFGVSAAAVLFLSLTGAYLISPNTDFMAQEKSELTQYLFAEIVLKSDNPTLLNYGFLDGGFYTAADILPVNKYFCKINLSDPAIMESQNAIIKNKLVGFVVLRLRGNAKQGGQDVPYLWENYEIVASVQQDFDNIHFTYVLYQAK